MSGEEFRNRFLDALAAAGAAASDSPPPDYDQIELHHFGVHDCDFVGASERLYLGTETFFKVIDVAVQPKRKGWFFVRPSGHEPGPWSETRFPESTGPFNVMTPL